MNDGGMLYRCDKCDGLLGRRELGIAHGGGHYHEAWDTCSARWVHGASAMPIGTLAEYLGVEEPAPRWLTVENVTALVATLRDRATLKVWDQLAVDVAEDWLRRKAER